MPFGHLAARSTLVAAALLLGAGCGDDAPPPNPSALLGTYGVDVSANGKTDRTIMTVSLGSSDAVLLNFTMGISTVRCQVMGSTELTLPRQTLHVDHASGVAEGQATGGGTIDAMGAVDLTISLSTVGFATDAGANGAVDYTIKGQRQ